MRVCSVVSNFAIPWTVAPPQTAAHSFSVHVIPQARILEWVAVSYARGLLVTLHELRLAKSLQSCLTLCDPIDIWQPTRLPRPWDSPGKNTGVGCRFLLQCMKVKSESEVAQSCPTLSDPMDCSLPGSSIYGIFQAKVLEWDAIAFSGIEAWGTYINTDILLLLLLLLL